MWIAGTFVEQILQFDNSVTVICSRQIKDGLPKNRRFLDDCHLPIKMVIDRRFAYENGDS